MGKIAPKIATQGTSESLPNADFPKFRKKIRQNKKRYKSPKTEKCPKENYIKLTLKVTETEFFDESGKLIILTKPIKKNAILHSDQFNHCIRFQRIKDQMWTEICEENRWNLNPTTSVKKLCKFITVRIPRKCAPITYHI